MSWGHVDAATGGAFLSLTIDGSTVLIEKMASNQSWGEERSQKQQKGMHTMKEAGMLATKNGPINEEVGRACPRKRSNEGPHLGHRFAYDMRSLSQC